MKATVHVCSGAECIAPTTKTLAERLKCSEHAVFFLCFSLFTSKCASRRSCVHCLSNATSKSAPQCFQHFDLETCLAPQPRARFQQRNFQKRSDAEVFCSILTSAVACTFWTHSAKRLRARRFRKTLRSRKAWEKQHVSRLF